MSEEIEVSEEVEEQEEEELPRVRTTTVEDFLECRLTDEELIDCAKDQNAQIKQRSRLEGQRKAYNSKIKSEIESCEECISELSNKISSQSEYRHIECRKVEDFDEGTILVIRLDTGEVIVDRKMTRAELAEADNMFIKYDESESEKDTAADEASENIEERESTEEAECPYQVAGELVE